MAVACASSAFLLRLIDLSSRRSCRCCKGSGTRRSRNASYGFRPGRSAHQAVERAQGYIQAGHRWVVDLDLEQFFDRVSHDILMSRVAKRVSDKRILKLIRPFLTAGVLENGLVGATDEGTPQGGVPYHRCYPI
ncbi:reverse transcriptase domain-containing protein [Luteibacter sp.]|uniref:reverse transcriptase domain-containing protein n=1 Tax=Luteibacter sp. TaxID=1886636 RepID=UPI0025C2B2B4|nr:reverse transcriptase domain-containing protein [Luteibacter sp.]